LQRAGLATKMVEQALVFGGRLSVAPELGRAEHHALLIEQHPAVLLAGDANAENLLTADPGCRQCLPSRLLEGIHPLLRLLLASAIGTALQRMAGAAGAQHLAAVGIQHQSFGALRAAIDTEVHVRGPACVRSVATPGRADRHGTGEYPRRVSPWPWGPRSSASGTAPRRGSSAPALGGRRPPMPVATARWLAP